MMGEMFCRSGETWSRVTAPLHGGEPAEVSGLFNWEKSQNKLARLHLLAGLEAPQLEVVAGERERSEPPFRLLPLKGWMYHKFAGW